VHVNDLLKIAVESGASDLHLKVGSYPMMRVRGHLTPALEDPVKSQYRLMDRKDGPASMD
jgi:Tfp pilus assembly pilus retraction ATPase PilT